ncbi:putative E3 ubiquitin-protein ligase RNF1/2 [Paratrimastix pyriformis]|uniref:RING-type E3 ubiquitin transferase n=1 Tax=Paratrimastix pyriformis TaxID=342808 RepID=A0ABQ8USS1_9EUKA|nr:putative E3 ubiquitin-protein ligase RNF1/2 [Paratrimastix pyriformis]
MILNPRSGTITEVVKQLGREFTCPICLEIIQKCTLVKACLHRFCYDCIGRSIRLGGKKTCPSCRAPLHSTRDLERDTHFDLLIATVLTDVSSARTAMDEETLRQAAALDLAALQTEMREAMERQIETKGIKLAIDLLPSMEPLSQDIILLASPERRLSPAGAAGEPVAPRHELPPTGSVSTTGPAAEADEQESIVSGLGADESQPILLESQPLPAPTAPTAPPALPVPAPAAPVPPGASPAPSLSGSLSASPTASPRCGIVRRRRSRVARTGGGPLVPAGMAGPSPTPCFTMPSRLPSAGPGGGPSVVVAPMPTRPLARTLSASATTAGALAEAALRRRGAEDDDEDLGLDMLTASAPLLAVPPRRREPDMPASILEAMGALSQHAARRRGRVGAAGSARFGMAGSLAWALEAAASSPAGSASLAAAAAPGGLPPSLPGPEDEQPAGQQPGGGERPPSPDTSLPVVLCSQPASTPTSPRPPPTATATAPAPAPAPASKGRRGRSRKLPTAPSSEAPVPVKTATKAKAAAAAAPKKATRGRRRKAAEDTPTAVEEQPSAAAPAADAGEPSSSLTSPRKHGRGRSSARKAAGTGAPGSASEEAKASGAEEEEEDEEGQPPAAPPVPMKDGRVWVDITAPTGPPTPTPPARRGGKRTRGGRSPAPAASASPPRVLRSTAPPAGTPSGQPPVVFQLVRRHKSLLPEMPRNMRQWAAAYEATAAQVAQSDGTYEHVTSKMVMGVVKALYGGGERTPFTLHYHIKGEFG